MTLDVAGQYVKYIISTHYIGSFVTFFLVFTIICIVDKS